MDSFPGPLHTLRGPGKIFTTRKINLKKTSKNVGMARQKVCKQGRDESKVTVFAKAHPYIFFTLQLDTAWESSKVHQPLLAATSVHEWHWLLSG